MEALGFRIGSVLVAGPAAPKVDGDRSEGPISECSWVTLFRGCCSRPEANEERQRVSPDLDSTASHNYGRLCIYDIICNGCLPIAPVAENF